MEVDVELRPAMGTNTRDRPRVPPGGRSRTYLPREGRFRGGKTSLVATLGGKWLPSILQKT